MSLESFITGYLASFSTGFFIRQYVVILCLFVFGAILSDRLLSSDVSFIKRCVLIFPTGLAAFTVTAYAMLVIGIPYNSYTVTGVILVEAVFAVIFNRSSFSSPDKYRKHMIFAVVAAAILAAVAVSGIAPVSLSNDSMYFFRRYPDCIVYYGGLRDQFDSWMTDTGLGVVSLDTLPALYGFAESFGIREFFHINFIAFFASVVYELALKYMPVKSARFFALITTLFLIVTTPFYILGHWALANMYFMEMFFIAVYSARDPDDGSIANQALLIIAFSLFRIEGAMFAVWAVLCLAVYTGKGKKLASYVLLPVIVLFGGYCLRIFVQYYLYDDLYLFLTPQKAVLIVALVAATFIYLMFIQPKLAPQLQRMLPCLYLLMMLGGNILLLIKDSSLYIGNLKAFGDNLFRQSGWGMLPYFVIAMTLFLTAEYAIMRIKGHRYESVADHFNITLVVGFFLMVVAASFGRGDILAEEVGDSGNRVLLQITPLVVITYAELFMRLYSHSTVESN